MKAMLFESKHVKALADGLLVDDDQTLETAGLLQSEVTVVYYRKEVEAARKQTNREEGLLQVNITSNITEIAAGAFRNCKSLARIILLGSVTTIGRSTFANCESLVIIAIPETVTVIRPFAFTDACLWKASLSQSV